jgi:hypothetical protein
VRSDNQKNAVLGVKVFLDLHKSFRASFEAQYMAFVDFVGQVRRPVWGVHARKARPAGVLAAGAAAGVQG